MAALKRSPPKRSPRISRFARNAAAITSWPFTAGASSSSTAAPSTNGTPISNRPIRSRFTDGRPYPERVATSQKATRSKEAIETGKAHVDGLPIAYGAFIFAFMGGSMGSVVGEKIARLFEGAAAERLPVVLLQASGGARMQEGILSLMQMAKTVAARERLRDAGVPFFSVLLHPTTGGVAASFAFLGDVNIAEPEALVGFAGPRVIETTIRQTLPEGFQRSEFLLEHGMVDRVTSRLEMKRELGVLIRHLTRAPQGTAAG